MVDESEAEFDHDPLKENLRRHGKSDLSPGTFFYRDRSSTFWRIRTDAVIAGVAVLVLVGVFLYDFLA